MSNLIGLGAGLIALVCGGFLLYLFLLGPLPYLISAAIKKVEGRNYWKAFGVFGISIVASFILQYVFKLFLKGFALSVVLFLVTIAVQILLTWLLYKVDFGKAFSVWIIAVLITIGIAIVVGVLVAILAGAAAVDLYNTIMQQLSFLPLLL